MAGRGRALAEADQATKRYGSFTAVEAVSMRVDPGEIVGLLGSNGAGKTTLIRMLLGLTRVSDGTVAVFGQAPDRTTRQRLGYVPQGLGLWETLTVQENIAFAAAAFGTDATATTLTPGLLKARDQQVSAIGLGLQRQLAFTIALAHRPKLLVLDEPTSGLDPLSRARLWDTIHDQADDGAGILVTTHYMQEAQQCDRLILMSHGQSVAEGTEAAIIGDTTACEVDTSGDQWAAAFAALDAAALPVTLAGRTVRLADTPQDTIHDTLAQAGIDARIREVPATLEEKMTVIERVVTAG
ncbi:ABC transporter related [Catenulispora acidiphila DSM 44928]|uniref:ABC transporter related n=1 Tax=Catenulispora acidiphila (strain DSM 44928 / JCM 14897 / NBRC 102108 / NRRL B-24433 / ID139908) TaxID=479433 RepID=C7PYB8_CATAD|nr:ABC transporter ATP-binding protein [Catenulispora acidiphila]ACU75408.1 ABC transporter related [Catenulispora acidiphila DSM 44928]